DLYNQGGRISYTQVYNRLRGVEGVDWNNALMAVTESFVSELELGPSVDSLNGRLARRRITQAAQESQQTVPLEHPEPSARLPARAQGLIFAATAKADTRDDIKDLVDVLRKCYLELLERRGGRRPSGLLVKYPSIDMLTTGFKKG